MIGQLARASGRSFEVRVLQSAAGFYLGTTDTDGFPYSRESVEYWPEEADAAVALTNGNWTQRTHS